MKIVLVLVVLIVSLLFIPILTALFNDPPQNLFAEGTTLHDMGDVLHDPETLANINTRITDATLDDIGDPRTPSAHAHTESSAVWTQPHSITGTATLATVNFSYGVASLGNATSDGTAYFSFVLPSDFVTLTKAVVLLRSSETGDLAWITTADYAADGEYAGTHIGAIGGGGSPIIRAMVSNQNDETDISSMFASFAADDHVGVAFYRMGSWGADTITSLYVLGLLIEYTN